MFNLSLLVHIIGVGLLFAGMIAVPIVESMFRTAVDPKSAHLLHKVISRLGLTTPIAAALLLVSGIGNILIGQIAVFTQVWLILKLIFFILFIAVGVVQGKAYRSRGRFVEAIALANAPETAPANVAMLTRRLSVFSRTQVVLLFCILVLTLFRTSL